MSGFTFNLPIAFRVKLPTKEESSTLEATALHEAGHAVANTLCGWKVRKVTICTNHLIDRNGGRCKASPRLGKEHTWQKRIICTFTGPISEALDSGTIWKTGANDDEALADSDARTILKEAGLWEDPPRRKRPPELKYPAENWDMEDEYIARMTANINGVLIPLWHDAVEFVGQNEVVIRAVANRLLQERPSTRQQVGLEVRTLAGWQVEQVMVDNGVLAEAFL